MNRKKINQWHRAQDEYGETTAQNPYIGIAYIRNMSEDTKHVLTRTIPHKYAQLS